MLWNDCYQFFHQIKCEQNKCKGMVENMCIEWFIKLTPKYIYYLSLHTATS